jgi:hypothetical protein
MSLCSIGSRRYALASCALLVSTPLFFSFGLFCFLTATSSVNHYNVCSILAEAEFYQATSLLEACNYYISCNMETLLESRFLDGKKKRPSDVPWRTVG